MLPSQSTRSTLKQGPGAPRHNQAGQIYFSESPDPRARNFAIVRVGSDIVDAGVAKTFFTDIDVTLSEAGHRNIVLDFRDVPVLPSVVFAELVRFHGRLKNDKGELRICHCGAVIRDVLRVTQLDRLLDVRTDLASALLN
jgi:anti-anti-sigma factor